MLGLATRRQTAPSHGISQHRRAQKAVAVSFWLEALGDCGEGDYRLRHPFGVTVPGRDDIAAMPTARVREMLECRSLPSVRFACGEARWLLIVTRWRARRSGVG